MRFFMCLLLAAALMMPCLAEEKVYMRVVARDDGIQAQREKMLVRNLALTLYPDRLEALPLFFPDCEVTERIWQPDKNTAPARTIYITVGQGLGQNWWGVLFPESLSWASRGEGERRICFPVFEWLLSFFSHR